MVHGALFHQLISMWIFIWNNGRWWRIHEVFFFAFYLTWVIIRRQIKCTNAASQNSSFPHLTEWLIQMGRQEMLSSWTKKTLLARSKLYQWFLEQAPTHDLWNVTFSPVSSSKWNVSHEICCRMVKEHLWLCRFPSHTTFTEHIPTVREEAGVGVCTLLHPGEHLCSPQSWWDRTAHPELIHPPLKAAGHSQRHFAIERLENLPEIYNKRHDLNSHLLNSRPLFLFSTANFNNTVISAGSTELTHFPFLLVSYEAVSPPKLLWATHISDLHNHLSIISEYIFIMTAPFLSS